MQLLTTKTKSFVYASEIFFNFDEGLTPHKAKLYNAVVNRKDYCKVMPSYTFSEISPERYDAFSAAHPQGNFQQTTTMAHVRELAGTTTTYCGVFENDTLIAATQLELHKSKLSCFTEIHDGPLCDLSNKELTSFLFENLKRLSKDQGAAQLEITPELPYQIHTSEGKALPAKDSDEPWPTGVPKSCPVEPAREAYQNLLDLGFIHAGFDTEYNAVPRWRYVKDLTTFSNTEELLASYAKNTKRNVRIAEENGVVVKQAGRAELPVFHAICEMSCEKQGFDNRPLSYFEQIYDTLGDKCEFKIAYIDARAHLASWEAKRDGFKADIEKFKKNLENAPKPEKIQKKLKDVEGKYEASLKRIETAQSYIAEDGEMIPVAAALFVWHPRECVYLFSGSNPKYAKFYGATAIQHTMMSECVERGCMRYNFYGINGIFDDPKDPGRGLLEFKQGFSGYVEEMMGSFTLIVKPAAYKAKQLAHKILGR